MIEKWKHLSDKLTRQRRSCLELTTTLSHISVTGVSCQLLVDYTSLHISELFQACRHRNIASRIDGSNSVNHKS